VELIGINETVVYNFLKHKHINQNHKT